MTRAASRCRTGAPERCGLALLGALWLVVMLSVVGLRLAQTVADRQSRGLAAAERVRDALALDGALALFQAELAPSVPTRLGEVARGRRRTGVPDTPRDPDPWRDPERRLVSTYAIDGLTVRVRALDLGARVNVNTADERALTVLMTDVLGDPTTATALAQAIADWRDLDDQPRARGGERDAYRRAGRAVLPANAAFRDVEDLRHVLGMTPARLDALRPFLAAHAQRSAINLNAAPAPVLRTLPGMTNVLLARILALRSGGRRVESIPDLVRATFGPGRSETNAADAARLASRLAALASVRTELLQVDLVARGAGSGAGPASRRRVVLRRGPDGSAHLAGQQ